MNLATIKDIKQSILDISEDEFLDLVRKVRQSRQTVKVKTKPKKTAKAKVINLSSHKPKTPADIIKTMNPAEKQALLKMLEERNEN